MSLALETHTAERPENGRLSVSSRRSIAAPALGALAALSIAFAAGLMFRRATTPWAILPDNDYWANIWGIITENGVRLNFADLLRHNNEHIILIPKLVYAANYVATSGSNIGLITYSIIVGSLCSALLLLMARGLMAETPLRFAICAVLFPLVMLSTKLTHSYFKGMSGVIWLTADLLVILSAAALARAVRTKSSIWLLIAFAAALLGVLTYSTAIYMLIVVLLFSLTLLVTPNQGANFSKPVLIGIVISIGAVLALGFAYRTHPAQHPAWVFDLARLAKFVLVYLGSSLPIPRSLETVGGLALISVGSVAAYQLIKLGRGKDMIGWIILFLFAPFNALMTGIGRLGYGMGVAESSRYQSVAAIGLIATVTLVLATLPQGPVSRPWAVARGLVFVGLLLSAPLIVLNPINLRSHWARNEEKVIAEVALRLGIPAAHHLKAATTAIEQLDELIPVLRGAHHVPFDRISRCEEMLGKRIPEPAGPSGGVLEKLATYETLHAGRAIELSGWAYRDGAAADCIAVLDGERKVIGAGASAIQRLDIAQAKGTPKLIGWQAVAHLPQSLPVCIVAFFSSPNQWLLLSNCQDAIANLQTALPTQ